MLVLSRRQGETIQIEDICIRITHIKGKRVTIGIEAPKSKRITRGELAQHSTAPAAAGAQSHDETGLTDSMASCPV